MRDLLLFLAYIAIYMFFYFLGSTYQKVGCFSENPDAKLIFNLRDKIDWVNFSSFVKRSVYFFYQLVI